MIRGPQTPRYAYVQSDASEATLLERVYPENNRMADTKTGIEYKVILIGKPVDVVRTCSILNEAERRSDQP